MTLWVERIVAATGWQPRGIQLSWTVAEEALGVELPGDFKELCATFGRGEFSGYVSMLASAGSDSSGVAGNLRRLHSIFDRRPTARRLYEPYGVYPEGRLIQWADTADEAEFHWLVQSDNPESWKIVARRATDEPWHELEMSTSEFLSRVLTDEEFAPFGIARHVPEASFEPLEE
ncbi:SMI1/KNR4 family protein [Streptomyces sp. NPDC093795]|uniref:SMI1/KNR4 family protein n=1 Tax=Streptomyces sp. NPDC093795 TaxID=3366051 RepID=UPI0038109869